MISQHRKALLTGAIVLAAGWTLAVGGYTLAGRARMTVEKIRRHVASVDYGALPRAGRHPAMDQVAQMLEALPPDEQHEARIECPWARWFPAMTPREKADLVEATLPSDFQNTLTAFDLLPEDMQSRAVEDSLKRLHTDQAQFHDAAPVPALSDAARQSLLQLGLKNFYMTSTAQEKTALAPVLEELHQMMEGGGILRQRRNF